MTPDLDLLAIGAHPDDAEIFAGGTLLAMKARGMRVGVVDLTAGEMGTYGSAEIRKAELTEAGRRLGLDARETLGLRDGFLLDSEENRLAIVAAIRRHRPRVVLTFGPGTRHPDHTHAAHLVSDAVFLAGLERIVTDAPAFRPPGLLQWPEFRATGRPDLVVDVTAVWEAKLDAIRAYGSQVTQVGESDAGTKTFIRSNDFWKVLEARALWAGHLAGCRFGEAFFSNAPPLLDDLVTPFAPRKKP